ncbi:microtubule-associated tumor suppressor candidate 2 homolog isoform X3 [Hippoglossus hippoglossus]|uniref:microtubule-associated tumor suppressor candidate 2 homolog isoform X3 n=1 Tax=Hippoglossus hippoglossus TaxID=8267 RepID=UPI00148E5A9E|nr:microtubule-associated tumor suppressor candidate 2 homolog isoform X3 [Hippoglossus hippoglossus]
MCERGEPFSGGELRNNNQRGGVLGDGDANANDIRAEDGGTLSGLVSGTARRDKVVILGKDTQCEDPDLAEFERLEGQELETYLVGDGEDFVGLAERKTPPGKSSVAADNNGREERKAFLRSASEQESTASHVSESREASRTELSSETDVFLSCQSNISSTATASRSQTTDSWHVATGPYSTTSEDLTSQACITLSERGKADPPSLSSSKSTTHQKDVDINLNSTLHSEDVALKAQVRNGAVACGDAIDEHRRNNNQRDITEEDCDQGRNKHKALPTTKNTHEERNRKMDKSTQANEAPDVSPSKAATKENPSSTTSKAIKKQGSFDNTMRKQNSFDRSFKKQPSFENTLKKQGSFEHSIPSGSSSLERRKPWGSPSRGATPPPSKTTSCSPKKRPPVSPAKVPGIRAPSSERSDSPQRGFGQTVKLPGKMSSGIPKPVVPPQHKEQEPRRSSSPQKPKNVRPKIITYVRASPQTKPQVTDAPNEASAPQLRSSFSSSPAHKAPKVTPQPKSTPVLCSSNLLFDKYRQEMQKAGLYPPGVAMTGASGTNPPRLSGKSGSFHEDEKYLQEQVSHEGGSVYRSPRALRPQLGLGAVSRQPAAKTRAQQTGQRSAPPQDSAGDHKSTDPTPKSVPLKPGQSGLRPPGFSALPPARLASFGFVRSSSVSSASSNQSNDSDPCRPSQHPSSGSDDTLSHKQTPGEASHGPSRPHPPNAPSLQRRSLPPQRSSPMASRREVPKDTDAVMSPKSSPKRLAVVSPKPQSPARGQTAAVHGSARTDRAQELDRALVQQLRERCEQQALQLLSLQAQLKKASLCLDVFSITTQHFCQKSERAIVKERELSQELARIRDEVAFSVAHWEQLQREKEELERRFEAELQGLRAQQQRELGALEERLKAQHIAEDRSLKALQRDELDDLRMQQQEQIEEMSENHEASLVEMETAHNDTLTTLQEEHARTVKNLKMAHEQQRKSLDEDFQKIRLSLQDQVDTLTFQNRSLRDRAKRFEEALRKSTDEQIVDALAPYKHIEEDLKSLKDVLEMKNQQIHQQDLKITELEIIAEKNVYLEERVQVLQQQNEDLKERIDKNLVVSRQLSEDNANLQVNVEKESNEKKRLSRNNEELLWRLQTGELSPRMSPSSSPIHRPSPGPGSPGRPHSYHQ